MSVIFLVSVVDDMVRYRRSISAQSLFFFNVLCFTQIRFLFFFSIFPLAKKNETELYVHVWIRIYVYMFTH